MKRFLVFFVLLMASCLSMGCGAASAAATSPGVIASFLPAIFEALGTAEGAMNLLGVWANRFKDVPQVADKIPDLQALLASSRASFARARELARKGAEFEQEARELYREGRQTLDQAVALVTSLGMYRNGRLVPPPSAAPRAGCPRAESVDEVVLELPPNQV